jgi:hypothetical protein
MKASRVVIVALLLVGCTSASPTTTGGGAGGGCQARGDCPDAGGPAGGPDAGAAPGVSVTDHGAKGDGTTDDTSAFDGAIQAAKGGTVLVPGPATYEAAGIGVGVAGTTIQCTGGAVVRLLPLKSGDGAPLFAVTAGDVTFRDCTLDGNKAKQAGYPEGFNDSYHGRMYRTGVWMTGADGLTVSNCAFKDFYGAGITTHDVSGISVMNSTFSDDYFESIFASSSVVSGTPGKFLTGFTFTQNHVTNARSGDASINANGALLAQFSDVTIDGNVIDGVERDPIKIENSTGTASKHATVTNNDFRNGDMSGYCAANFQSGGHYFDVSHNTCTNVGCCVGASTVVGYQFSSDSVEYISITHNTVSSVHAGNMADAIELICSGPSMHHVTIDSNTISNVPRDAIQLREINQVFPNATEHDITITNNTVTNAGTCIDLYTSADGPTYVTPTNVTNSGNSCH